MSKRAKKKTTKASFPDLVFCTREHDANDPDASYLSAHEEVGTASDGFEWREFAIYKKVGTGRIRQTTKTEVNAPDAIKQAVVRFEK